MICLALDLVKKRFSGTQDRRASQDGHILGCPPEDTCNDGNDKGRVGVESWNIQYHVLVISSCSARSIKQNYVRRFLLSSVFFFFFSRLTTSNHSFETWINVYL